MSTQVANSRAELMRRRINACCKGLLEAVSNAPLSLQHVNYLHRSVKDFLEREDTWTTLLSATNEKFNPNQRLSNLQIMRLKTPISVMLSDDCLMDFATYGIEYAIRADPDCRTCQSSLINAIDRAATEITTLPTGTRPAALRWVNKGLQGMTTLLEFAVKCQLDNYVQATLRTMPQSKVVACVSRLLCAAVLPPHYSLIKIVVDKPALRCNQMPSRKLIKALLDYGADPGYVLDRLSHRALSIECINDDIAEEFLLHGADPRHPRLKEIHNIFSDNIQRLIKRKMKETRWSCHRFNFRKRT